MVIQADARVWGGNEKWLTMVALGLADRGHEVVVSCKPGSAVERAVRGRVRITHSRPGGDADLVRALGFARMLRRERPDAVLLTAFKRSFWGGWAARRAGVRRVVERLGIERDLPGGWKYPYAFRHFIDALIVNSSVIRERWLHSAPWFPRDEVHVILNGVTAPPAAPGTLRAELQLPADALVFVTAGRLEARKGIDTLIDAFAAQQIDGAHLVIAGAGPAEAELRARAAATAAAQRIHWLGFRSELAGLLGDADVFVLASRREGMANVMLEAMAARLLVVATDISGVREAIGERDGRRGAGLIVPPDDAAALGRALRDAAADARSERGAAMRAEAAWRALNWFSPERVVLETEAVLLGGARPESGPS